MQAACPECDHAPDALAPEEVTVSTSGMDWIVSVAFECPNCGAWIDFSALAQGISVYDGHEGGDD